MGTGFELNASEDSVGIIPRAVRHLFNGVDTRKHQAKESGIPEPTFQVLAQFMELYNEEIYDLFATDARKAKSNIRIHEDANGSIYTQGVASQQVNSYEEVRAETTGIIKAVGFE